MGRKKIKNATDQRSFTIIYNDFIDSAILKSDEKLIFIALKRFSDNNGQCFPSLNKLSSVTGLSKRKVQGTINSLVEKGILSKEVREREDGGQTSNLYNLYDYAGMWKIKKSDSNKKIADEMEEVRMIEILTAKGYSITKEKVPASVPTKEQTQATKKTIFNNNNDTATKIDCQEKYTLEDVKVFYDYDKMILEEPEYIKEIDCIIDILYDVLNTSKKTIRVQGEDKPATIVISKLMKLYFEDIFYVIEKYNEQTDRIKNPKAYMLTLLYGAKEQKLLDVKNQVNHDMANWDA